VGVSIEIFSIEMSVCASKPESSPGGVSDLEIHLTFSASGLISDEDIVHEGYLQKRSRGRRSKKHNFRRRYVVLTKHALYYYNQKVCLISNC